MMSASSAISLSSRFSNTRSLERRIESGATRLASNDDVPTPHRALFDGHRIRAPDALACPAIWFEPLPLKYIVEATRDRLSRPAAITEEPARARGL